MEFSVLEDMTVLKYSEGSSKSESTNWFTNLMDVRCIVTDSSDVVSVFIYPKKSALNESHPLYSSSETKVMPSSVIVSFFFWFAEKYVNPVLRVSCVPFTSTFPTPKVVDLGTVRVACMVSVLIFRLLRIMLSYIKKSSSFMLPLSYLIWATAATTGGLFNFLHCVFIFQFIGL